MENFKKPYEQYQDLQDMRKEEANNDLLEAFLRRSDKFIDDPLRRMEIAGYQAIIDVMDEHLKKELTDLAVEIHERSMK